MNFAIAIKANIPMLRVETIDPPSLWEDIESIGEPLEFGTLPEDKRVGYFCGDVDQEAMDSWYQEAEEHSCTIVFVNCDDLPDFVVDCGDLKPSEKDIGRMLLQILDKGEDFNDIVRVCHGFYLSQIRNSFRVIFATNDGEVFHASEVRRELLRMSSDFRGLELVNTGQFYKAPQDLETITQLHKPFFFNAPHTEVQSRGMLLEGVPGGGKTSAAKHIALQWNLDLYRIDLQALLDKWMGGSEHNVRRMLALADELEPCVLLLDEVDKMFRESSDTGTESRILSMLLWWLQERTAKVYVVATCNDLEDIPEPLKREGRFDCTVTLLPFTKAQAKTFMISKLKSMDYLNQKGRSAIRKIVEPQLDAKMTGATVCQMIYDAYRKIHAD